MRMDSESGSVLAVDLDYKKSTTELLLVVKQGMVISTIAHAQFEHYQ